MKILFVRPKQSKETIGLQHIIIVEPLELEVLAALTDSADEPVIVDMILEKKKLTHFLHLHKPEILCVTGYITNIPQMISYCETAKRELPQITTIVGGVHVEKFPEDIESEFVDYRIVRNATRAFPGLLSFIKGESNFPPGVLKKNEKREEKNLPEFDFYFPLPRRDLTKQYQDKYFYIFQNKVALLKTSFGCPYNCSFCYCIQITNHKYHVRDIEDVLNELEKIEQKEIYIVDDDFIVSPDRTRAFIAGLKQRNINKKYLIFGRADFIVRYPNVIKEFKEVGLRAIIVGFESFSNTELTRFNKQIDSSSNEKAMHILNKYGIDCYASVIVDPSWAKRDFKLFVKKAKELNIEYVVLQPLTPLPGTGMDISAEQMLIKRNDFARWDLAHVAVKPEKLSLPEFYKCILEAYRKIAFSPKTILAHTRYPLRMQWKILKGLMLIHKKYKTRHKQAKRDV